MNMASHRAGSGHLVTHWIALGALLTAGILLTPLPALAEDEGKPTTTTEKLPGGGTKTTSETVTKDTHTVHVVVKDKDGQKTDTTVTVKQTKDGGSIETKEVKDKDGQTTHVIKKDKKGDKTEETDTSHPKGSGVTTTTTTTYLDGKPVATTITTKDPAGTTEERQEWDKNGNQKGGYLKTGGKTHLYDGGTKKYADGTTPSYGSPPTYSMVTGAGNFSLYGQQYATRPVVKGDRILMAFEPAPPEDIFEGFNLSIGGVLFAGRGNHTVTTIEEHQEKHVFFTTTQETFTHDVLVDNGFTKVLTPVTETKDVKEKHTEIVTVREKKKHDEGNFDDTAGGISLELGYERGFFGLGLACLLMESDEDDLFGGVETNFYFNLLRLSCICECGGRDVRIIPYLLFGPGFYFGNDTSTTGHFGAGLKIGGDNGPKGFVDWQQHFGPHQEQWSEVRGGLQFDLEKFSEHAREESMHRPIDLISPEIPVGPKLH
jgi:hypothetical protein